MIVACTTSPAETGTTPAGPETSSRPPSSMPVASPSEALAGGQLHPYLPPDGGTRVGVRRPQRPPARRARTRRTRSAAAPAAPTAGRCGRRRGPRPPARWPSSCGSSSRVMPTLMPMPDHDGRTGRGLDPLGEDAGQLAVVEQHVVGPLQDGRGAEPAQRHRRGVPGQQRQPRPVRGRGPRAGAAATTSAPSGPASPTSGPAGRGRRSGARRPRRAPRRPPARARSATSGVGRRASRRPPRRTSRWA